jgi:hypothetical protein
MQLTSRAKLTAGILGLLVIAAYLVVLDLGIHAGRVHRGVTVGGHEVGNLNFAETVQELERRREELMERPLRFTSNGFEDEVTREQLGWSPQPFETALDTFDVGRGDPWSAARDRLQAWFGGVDIDWAGGARSGHVGRLLSRWRRAGIDVDERAARSLLRRIIGRDVSTSYEIPLN